MYRLRCLASSFHGTVDTAIDWAAVLRVGVGPRLQGASRSCKPDLQGSMRSYKILYKYGWYMVDTLFGTWLGQSAIDEPPLSNFPQADRHEVFAYFGTCSRAILSMFELLGRMRGCDNDSCCLQSRITKGTNLICLLLMASKSTF